MNGLEGMTPRELIKFGKEAEERGDLETRDEVIRILTHLMNSEAMK